MKNLLLVAPTIFFMTQCSAVDAFVTIFNSCSSTCVPIAPSYRTVVYSSVEDESLTTITATSVKEQQTTGTELAHDSDKEENLMQKIKDSGLAGIISYAFWELGFWTVSVPVCILGYKEVTGHWPDLHDRDDISKLGAEAFAFVNFARIAVPLRIGLALGTTPWIQENVVDVFFHDEDEHYSKEESTEVNSFQVLENEKPELNITTEGIGASTMEEEYPNEMANEKASPPHVQSRFRIRSRIRSFIRFLFRRKSKSP